MQTTTKWEAGVMSELRVAGHDSEWSDLDNPRGEIIVEVFFVVLVNQRGDRLAGPIIEAGRESGLPAAIQRSLDKGFDPTSTLAFQPIDPVYGSEAYQVDGIELERYYCERKDAGLPMFS